MMLRSWIYAMEHDERESEPDRDRTVTNGAEETTADDHKAIIENQENFQQRPTGTAVLTDFLHDKLRWIIYFYVQQNSSFFYYWTCVVAAGILYNMFAMVIFIFDDVQQGYFTLCRSENDFWLSEDDTNAFGFSYYKVFDPRFPTCDTYFDKNCWFPENAEGVLDLREERPKYMQQMYQYWENKYTLLSMGNFSREYSMTIYWSSLTITKCGQQPWPSTSPQNALEIFDTLIGVLVFATIIGSVGNVVTQMSKNVNDFREMMDGIKFYMKYRGVQSAIQERVLNCFLYLNTHNQLYDEKEIISVLPPRFQASIAANLHAETLSKVALFHKYVYILHQDDVTRLLQEYPDERLRLLENARRTLHSRGLLQTTGLGEMLSESTDDFEEDGVLDLLSVDEQLIRLDSIILNIDHELGQMIQSFTHTSGFFKKRVTCLEETFNFNKKRIRNDLYNGILKTDYQQQMFL
ncbi:unnamed protein product [Caenorhabditis sp. 36 PRJEB53466]|nr:unnamed protein product [Caenorhabditis sp. 36 PRJEB53466]